VRRALGPGTELLIDSGIRRGVDIVKAVALGAQAAAIARPVLFGAAIGGDQGALCAIDILLDEAKRAMTLCGTPSVRCDPRGRCDRFVTSRCLRNIDATSPEGLGSSFLQRHRSFARNRLNREVRRA
jgi:hypothetical protein